MNSAIKRATLVLAIALGACVHGTPFDIETSDVDCHPYTVYTSWHSPRPFQITLVTDSTVAYYHGRRVDPERCRTRVVDR